MPKLTHSQIREEIEKLLSQALDGELCDETVSLIMKGEVDRCIEERKMRSLRSLKFKGGRREHENFVSMLNDPDHERPLEQISHLRLVK
jgi:hypothetical protein